MKNLFKFLGKSEKKVVSAKSPVYAFFAEADATAKTKAYRKALKGASRDQMLLLSRYNKDFSKVN